MAEIPPIISSPTVAGLRKIERDEARKDKQQKPLRPEKKEPELADSEPARGDFEQSNEPGVQHIDERV